jgi:methyltransferase (TIGR00027 family)
VEVGQPSRTAFATARARALHQIADPPRVFTDPLAIAILGVDPAELIQPDDLQARRTQLFIALRSRFADDAIADAVAKGTRQVVVLGAGLDTFGCRNPHAGVRVFEIDHPDTQVWKRARLADADIDIPPSLVFAPVDFEHRGLDDGLMSAGFDRTLPAIFVWLGVVQYLTGEAVLVSLQFIASRNACTAVVFDYREPPSTLTGQGLAEFDARAQRVADLGEPWLTFFTPSEIVDTLTTIGFDTVADHTGADLYTAYTGRRPRADTRSTTHVVLGLTA